jgi:hypothetical protein
MAERLSMQRSVSQLLFHYLPGRTVDWEDGMAIIQLTQVHFSSIWPGEQAAAVLGEVALLFDRWRKRCGTIDPQFPDLRTQTGQFAVGTPEAIEAVVLDTAFVCQTCSRLHFINLNQLTNPDSKALVCTDCEKGMLRQLGQVFVHGCGDLIPIRKWMPATKRTEDGFFEATNHPLECQRCHSKGRLFLPARSERVKDMKLICKNCGTIVRDRFTANCARCLRDLSNQRRRRGGEDFYTTKNEFGCETTGSVIARIAMRMSRYSASATYYPQSFSILRLDRPAISISGGDELGLLRRMLPVSRRPGSDSGVSGTIDALSRKLKEAEALHNRSEVARLRGLIAQAAMGQGPPPAPPDDDRLVPSAADLERAVDEAIAFRTTVDSRSAIETARRGGSASSHLIDQIQQDIQRLGVCEFQTVSDLPMISATYGYTRRTFEPVYDELTARNLPTQIRAFTSVDRDEARRMGRPDLQGTIPILAREGEHEGIFLGLCPDWVVRWLELNNVRLSNPEMPPVARIMNALEDVDRYYDNIWDLPVRRLVFGLIHTLSHAAMRAATRYAGLERTSLSEYIFLPLLGTVIFDNSSAFKLGGLETLVRDHLLAFLNALADDAMTCLYDAQCIDHKGACHGCIHSPEISCRVFNHGLSRSFLIGGHAPWVDVATNRQIIGYWQMDEVNA